ncbi:MAG: hypothetical protein ACOC92_01560 [bacterium]
MRRLVAVVRRHLEVRDVWFYGGILLLSLGAGMVYRPASLIVAGGILVGVAVFGVAEAREGD